MRLGRPLGTKSFYLKTNKNLNRMKALFLAGTALCRKVRICSISLLAVGAKTPQDLATAFANPQKFIST